MNTILLPEISFHASLSAFCGVMLLSLSACSGDSFKVDGDIEGADGGSIILQKASPAGQWIEIDSTRLSKSGHFSFKPEAPAAPEIYRLEYAGKYLYFPVDSTEHISVSAPATAFDTRFTLSGSANAEDMARFERRLIAASPSLSNPDSLEAFKRGVYAEYLQDARGSVVSYYILTKTLASGPLFDPVADSRYYAAVATSFRQFRPDDPRTSMLEAAAKRARAEAHRLRGDRTVYSAGEISLIDISLPDASGERIPLSKRVGGGKSTILMVAVRSDPATPAINVRLRGLYDSGAINVYQAGTDADISAWRSATSSLPWTCVYAGSQADAANLAASYQITQLPAFFVIDGQGALKARAATVDDAIRQAR